MSTSIASFADSEIRMRYREPYATQGLNAKFAVNTPRGVYRGFRLGPHAAVDTVTVEADPTHSDHAGVYETLDGFSMMLRRVGGGFSLSLVSLVDPSEKEWVICIYADYAVGSATIAEIRAYEFSPTDEFTPAPEHDELIVLGTVTIPAAGGIIIPTDNINSDRRTSAYEAKATEAISWRPVLRNPGFEQGETGIVFSSGDLDIEGWSLLASTLTYKFATTDVGEGSKSLQINKVTGSYSGEVLYQEVGMQVVEGQRARVRLLKKSLADAAPGGTTSVEVFVRWFDDSWTLLSDTVLPNVDLNNVAGDAAYVAFDKTVTAPSGANALHGVGVRFVGTMTGGTEPLAPWLKLDGFQCWVEAPSPEYALPEESDRKALWGDSLVLIDGDQDYSGSFGKKFALLRYDATIGGVAGQGGGVVIESARSTEHAPNLVPKGLISDLGSDYLSTDEDAADHPRIKASTRNNTYTLLEEVGIEGEVKKRRYSSTATATNDEQDIVTINARWDSTLWKWVSDAAAPATIVSRSKSGTLFGYRDCVSAGEDWTSWDRYPLRLYAGGFGTPQLQLGQSHPMLKAPLVVNSFGALHYRGVKLYEEFDFPVGTLPNDRWGEQVDTGTVTEAYGDRTVVRLMGMAVYARIYTLVPFCDLTDQPGFSVTFRVNNATHFVIGLSETSGPPPNFNFGLYYNNAMGSNLRVGIEDAGGSHNYFEDTGFDITAAWGDWLTVNVYMRDAGTSTPDILYSIQEAASLTELASGLYRPGVAARNYGSNHHVTIQAGPDADLRVDSIVFYTNPAD